MKLALAAASLLSLHIPPPRRASPSHCCAAPAAIDQNVQIFESLLSGERVNNAIALETSSTGRSLVATKDIEAGGVLLSVPKRLLLTAHRSGVVDGLAGQTELTWEAAGDLREEVGEENFKRGATWDARLSLGLFEACGGAGGEFWDVYRVLQPPPPRVTHPLTMPDALLDELQDEAIATATRELRARLVSLYPDLDAHSCHTVTASYEQMGAPMDQIPKPLEYMYALVVSRCFAMSDGDTFAFVPFLDMADHAARPSANFGSDPRGFVLRALKPLARGQPITICYGEDYTTARLFSQYGFSPANGTAQDAKWLAELAEEAERSDVPAVADALADAIATPLSESTVGVQALGAAFEQLANSSLSTAERRAAIFDALVPDEESGAPAGAAAAAAAPRAVPPAVLLAAVRWRLGEFPTTLKEDETLLEQLLANGPRGVDPRLVAVLEYRLARKRLLTLTDETLGTFLGQ